MQVPSLNLKKGGQAGKTSFFYWLLIIAHSTKHLIIYSQLCASCTILQKHIICAFVLYVICALKLHVSCVCDISKLNDISEYLRIIFECYILCPLEFWKKCQNHLQGLAKIAKKY